MSLIAWFPFNGDTNNQGIDSGSLISTNTYSNGKVTTSCAYFNGSTQATLSTTTYNYTSNFSFTLWLNHTGFNSSYGGANYIFTNGRADAGGLGYGIQVINDNEIRIRFGNSSIAVEVKKNEWHHICCSISSQSTLSIFVDGKYIDSFTPTSLPTYSDGAGLGLGGFYYSSGVIYRSKCYINDFRIYDHCLSKKEVRQLSKGLCLHYNFNDLRDSIYTTTNLEPNKDYPRIVGLQSAEKTYYKGRACYKCTVSASNSGGWFGAYASYSASGTYTRSCWLCVPSGQNQANWYGVPYAFENVSTIHARVNYDLSKLDTWQYCYESATGSGNFLYYMIAGSYGSGTITYYIAEPQLEVGSMPTPYTINSRVGGVPDVSGYSNTGIPSNIGISSDTKLGNNSCVFNNSQIITSYNTYGLTNLTYAAWVYPTTYSNNDDRVCICIGGTYLTIDKSGHLSGYAYGKNPEGYHTGTKVIPTKDWTHIAIVWSDTHIIGYINGSEDFKVACTGTFSQAVGQQIGREGTSGRKFYGNIADLKIFATALDENDIAQLYNNKAVIDKSGNIYCDSVNTKFSGNIKLPTKTGIIKCGDISKNIIAKISGYTRLEYIESSGTQYINTGYSNSEGFAAEISFMLSSVPSASSGYMIGCHNLSSPYGRNGFQPYYGQWQLGHGDNYPVGGTPLANTLYYGDVDTKKGAAYLKINGETVLTDNSSTTLSSSNILIFTDQYILTYQGTTLPAKVYSCKIYTPNKTQIVRDFIPVKRNKDNAIGLLDRVNNQFYENAGSGSFIAGPEYSRIIQCNNFYTSDGYNGRPYLDSDYIELDYIDQVNPAAGAASQHNRCAIPNVAYNKIEGYVNVNGSGTSGGIMLSGGSEEWWKSWQGGGSDSVTMSPSSLSQNTWTTVTWTCSSSYNGLRTSGWSDSINYWTPQNLKVKYIKTYYSTNLTGYFIPALRKIDGKPGLYDKVTGTFYTNVGSGEFVAGPVSIKNYLV